MKLILCALLGFVLPWGAWSQIPGGLQVPDLSSPVLGALATGTYTGKEMAEIIAERPNLKLSDLTMSEYASIAARMQIAKKKDESITDAVKSSLLLPGLAQFKDGNAPVGTLFAAGDLGIAASAGYVAYLLVPEGYKNGTKPFSLSLDILPAVGMIVAGWVVWEGWGTLAASYAVPERRTRLDTDKFTIVPELSNGEMGFSLKW